MKADVGEQVRMHKLKLDVTLTKLSSITIAECLWEPQDVKNIIREFFEEFKSESDDDVQKTWISSVVSYVVQQVNSLDFPFKLIPEIKNYVFTIGGEIFNFIRHVTKNGLGIDFGLNIIWAPFGRIDEVRMARRLLTGYPNRKPLPAPFLSLADIYTDPDLVRADAEKMWKEADVCRKLAEERYKIFEKQNPLCPKNLRPYIFDGYKFLCCFISKRDFPFSAIYFWDNLIAREKKCCALYAAEEFWHLSYRLKNNYLLPKHVQALVFFINQISDDIRREFILNNIHLFKPFLITWPWRELFSDLMSLTRGSRFEYSAVLDSVVKCLLPRTSHDRTVCESFSYQTVKYNLKNDYHIILRNLLEITPNKIKLDYFKNQLEHFSRFHQSLDFVTISIIVNDPSLKEVKWKIISKGEPLFTDLVEFGDYKELDKYMEAVLSDDNEKKIFKQRLNRIDELVCDGEIEVASDLLNWIYDTEVERKEAKNKVDPMLVYKFFWESRYDLALEFIEWRYDTEEERMNFKKTICSSQKNDQKRAKLYCKLFNEKDFGTVDEYLGWRFEIEIQRRNIRRTSYLSDDYIRDEFLEIWCTMDPYEEKSVRNYVCTALLTYFLKSEEEVNKFRYYRLLEENSFFKKFKNYEMYYSCFDSCYEFLKFCGLTPEEIKDMRHRLGRLISEEQNDVWWD